MIVLDTNVLSEPLKANPDEQVLAWLDAAGESTVITSVSVGELLLGARRLPRGRRREGLLIAIEHIVVSYADQVLPYDEQAARCYAGLQELRRSAGRPLSVEDGMIAATCLTRGASLATRNISDFNGLDLGLVDPWSPAS